MSTTRPRAPINEHANPIELDDGTLVRTESEPPGTVGLQAKGGRARKQAASTDPVSYARAQLRRRVGNGECFTLVNRALRESGYQSARDFGSVAPGADYVWGQPVELADVLPGDIVQLRDYRYERTIVTKFEGVPVTDTDGQTRPHHTAIVELVDGSQITVLEQNAPPGSAVRRNQLFFEDTTTSSDERTITIRVSGTFWFYRPQTS